MLTTRMASIAAASLTCLLFGLGCGGSPAPGTAAPGTTPSVGATPGATPVAPAGGKISATDPKCSQGAPKSEACGQCITGKCGASFGKSFGPNWLRGDFTGGACADYAGCAAKCACDDKSCVQQCMGKMTPACMPAVMEMGMCVMAQCGGDCKN